MPIQSAHRRNNHPHRQQVQIHLASIISHWPHNYNTQHYLLFSEESQTEANIQRFGRGKVSRQ